MNRKTIIMVVLAVFLGVGLGVGGTIGVQKFILKSDETGSVAAKTVKKVDGPIVPIGDFTVNLQGGSFLKAAISVEGIDSKSAEILKAKDAFIKDRIITVLSSKSISDMNPVSREKLKAELLAQLNDVTGNTVQNVLFISFVYQ